MIDDNDDGDDSSGMASCQCSSRVTYLYLVPVHRTLLFHTAHYSLPVYSLPIPTPTSIHQSNSSPAFAAARGRDPLHAPINRTTQMGSLVGGAVNSLGSSANSAWLYYTSVPFRLSQTNQPGKCLISDALISLLGSTLCLSLPLIVLLLLLRWTVPSGLL